jgi:hypothetical protein
MGSLCEAVGESKLSRDTKNSINQKVIVEINFNYTI